MPKFRFFGVTFVSTFQSVWAMNISQKLTASYNVITTCPCIVNGYTPIGLFTQMRRAVRPLSKRVCRTRYVLGTAYVKSPDRQLNRILIRTHPRRQLYWNVWKINVITIMKNNTISIERRKTQWKSFFFCFFKNEIRIKSKKGKKSGFKTSWFVDQCHK